MSIDRTIKMNLFQRLLAEILSLPDLLCNLRYCHVRALVAARNWTLTDCYGSYISDANGKFLAWGANPSQAYSNAINTTINETKADT